MRILYTRTIYRDGEYATFPNLARLKSGQVICAFRHAKDRQAEFGACTHIDPTARDVFITSPDGGLTFDPELHTIVDDAEMSDQDPCVNVLSDGRIIVTYFRWALCPIGEGPARWGEASFRSFGRTLWDRYDCHTDGSSYAISDDEGRTWRHFPPLRMTGMPESGGVRGNIVELPSGELLLPFYGSLRPGELSRCGLLHSLDRGESWQYLSEMAYDPTGAKTFLEPGLYLTPGGKLVGLIRTQTDYRKPGVAFDDTYLNLHIAVSNDLGRSFGPVQEIPGVWGSNPFHALRLPDGKVLLTYGHRRPPFGIRARICDPELEHIADGEEIILRDDAPNGDLGYPNSILLDDGTALVAYYISGRDGVRTIDVTALKQEEQA